MEENCTEILQKFKCLIQNHCGMLITDVHSRALEKFLEEESRRTGKSYSFLYDTISVNNDEMINLINAVAVNETYFFREQKQFEFIQNYLQKNFFNKEVVIWSAACSTGEEPYSLASLALSCNTKPVVYATDIDTDALLQLKNGVYGDNSFRPDGSEFKEILSPYINETENSIGKKIYAIKSELKSKILCSRANLLDLDSSNGVPKNETVDIILIRNVFIYFDKNSRDIILKKLAAKLKKGGLLFFSISEIAGINPSHKDFSLVKKTKDSIYYFEKEDFSSAPAKNVLPQIKKEKNPSEKIQALFEKEKLNSDEKNKKSDSAIFVKTEEKEKTVFTPEELWEKIAFCSEKRDFAEAEKLIENYNPSVNQLYTKYYFSAFIYEAQKNKQKALENYEKAGISNPHFWPAFYQTAMLLQNTTEASLKRRQHESLIKAATILEDEKSECERYTYLMGAFSSSYFYQLCNDYLKKEFSL